MNEDNLNSDTHEEIRDAVRRLCEGFPGEYWRKLDREQAYPSAFVAALTEAGYLGALIPEEYGGSGLGLSAAAAILEEVHASGGNAGACHAQMYTMGTVLRHGSTEQKEKYLPEIAAGTRRLQAFGVTEPTSGTDTTALKTVARREGDHYVVNGQKIWTSRAEHSDLMLLLARTTPREAVTKRTEGISVFLVDMRVAKGHGLTIRPIRTMMNHATTEVFFDDLKIPATSLIGEEGKGFRYILSGMNAERILIASECIGDAKWFIAKATAYAGERVVFGRPIGQNQGVQFPIAKAYAQMRAAELMVQRAASLFEKGRDCGPEANMAKMLAAESSWAAAEACVQTHGGFGFAEEYDVERKFRETRLYQVAPISTNLILSYLAEHVLGLPRSYETRGETMTEPLDLKHLQQWVGRTETHGDTITPRLLEAFRAILDHPRGSLDAGETVPPGLHWCLAPHAVAMHDIGPDGHPARGGFLPPVPLPRRMWAGARLKFLRELKVGESVTRVSEVKSVTTKIGRTGPLCFVLVEHRLSNDGGIAVSEEHDIVYRGIDAPAGGSPQRCDAMGEADFERVIEPNPVLLFRYSAVTFNGHRIHYDRSYVTEVEGYPGLIVHGPLQATLLLDVVAKLQPARALKSFAFRATHPLFDPAPFKVKGRMLDEDHAQLWVEGAGGILHMDAKAAWSD